MSLGLLIVLLGMTDFISIHNFPAHSLPSALYWAAICSAILILTVGMLGNISQHTNETSHNFHKIKKTAI